MPIVILKTNYGDVTIELNAQAAPITTQNFLNYVNSGFYNGTIFHRVIGGFMIQGGGLTADMLPKPNPNKPIPNEANNGLKNVLGSVAMARTSDPHSATSQFFINVANNSFLDHTSQTPQGWGYAVFGKVISGMEVVNKISHTNTVNRAGHQDVPEMPITIESASLVEDLEEVKTATARL